MYSRPIPKYEASAIVYKDGDKVIARDRYGKLIAKGKAGVDDSKIVKEAVDTIKIGTLVIKDATIKEKTEINTNNIKIINSYIKFEGGSLVFIDTENICIINSKLEGYSDPKASSDDGLLGYGILRTVGVKNVKLINNYFYTIDSRNIYFGRSENNWTTNMIMSHNTFSGNSKISLCEGSGFGHVITSNTFNNEKGGALLTFGALANTTILGNNFYSITGSPYAGVSLEEYAEIYSGTGICYDNIVISSNTFNNIPSVISVNRNLNLLYRNITISNNVSNANNKIFGNLNTRFENLVIENNLITCDNDYHAIRIYNDNDNIVEYSKNIKISNNVIKNNTSTSVSGIILYAIDGIELYNNNISGNRGIYLYSNNGAYPCKNIIIVNNEIYGDYSAISLEKPINCEIYNNKLSGLQNIITEIGSVNLRIYNNIGYTTENHGTATINSDGTATTFTIPHGLVSTPNYVNVIPKGYSPKPDSIDADSTNITLTFSTAPSSGTYYYWWEARV